MSYKVPVHDIKFNLENLNLLSEILKLDSYQEFSTDIIDAVFDENARFVEEVIAPLNHSGDIDECQYHNGEVKTPNGFKDAFKQFGQNGWQSLAHSPEFGGQGFPNLIAASLSENINAANLAFSLCPLLTDGFVKALYQAGNDFLKKTFIPPMLEGKWTGTMNLTEAQAGSDLSLIRTKATPQEDGTYRIKGEKIFITWGEHDVAENIAHLVLARTPDAPQGVKGISLFVVPKYLVNEDGSLGKRNDVFCSTLEDKLGIHGSPTCVMRYGDDKGEVGEGAIAYLVGEENSGLRYMFIMMNEARFNVGVQGIAVAERATQKAFAYAQERQQGNLVDGSSDKTVTINQHPDVQRMLLTMRGLTQGARAISLYAAYCHDLALNLEKSQSENYQAIYEYLVPIVKGFSTEMANEVASLGIQVHGGMGYIEETGAAQYYRDARILSIYEGTTAIQANDLLGRKTWRDAGQSAQYLADAMLDTAELASQSEDPGLQAIASDFVEAVQAFGDVVKYLLQQGQQEKMQEAFAANVNYLMLSGYLFSAWLLLKSVLNATEKNSFYDEKKAMVLFYISQILPRTISLKKAILTTELAVESFKLTEF